MHTEYLKIEYSHERKELNWLLTWHVLCLCLHALPLTKTYEYICVGDMLTYLKATISLTKASHSHLYLMHQSDRPSGCNHYPMVVPFSFCVSICCSYQWLLFFNERLDFSAWYFEIQSDLELSLPHCNWQSVSLVRPNQTSSMWLKTLSAKALLYWKKQKQLLLTVQLTQLLWWKKAHFLSGVLELCLTPHSEWPLHCTASLHPHGASFSSKSSYWDHWSPSLRLRHAICAIIWSLKSNLSSRHCTAFSKNLPTRLLNSSPVAGVKVSIVFALLCYLKIGLCVLKSADLANGSSRSELQ